MLKELLSDNHTLHTRMVIHMMYINIRFARARGYGILIFNQKFRDAEALVVKQLSVNRWLCKM